jgi:curved DNA-binding protein
MDFKDYYKTLGVDRKADQKAVRQAFRRLAREHHPDVNKKKGAEDRFKEVNEAYQVLSDPEKRARYDQIYDAYQNGGALPWQDLLGGRGAGAGPSVWTGPGGVTYSVGSAEDLDQIFGRGGFSDFFQQLFGGLGGFGEAGRPERAQRATRRHPRIEATAEVSLEEAFKGTKRRIQIPGADRRIEVEIPPGVRSGQTMRLAGAAEGQDLYLTVHVSPHPRFERADDDLTIEVPITMSEAALGAEITVPTLGQSVTMSIPPETQTGRRFRLKGLGTPHTRSGGHGDLYVRVKVVTPTNLSKRERELFEELRKLERADPRRNS